jgi:peroxiredoxin Q/BCP
LRDDADRLEAAGLHVLGISFDNIDENRAFAEKFDFPFRLLCDVDRSVGVAYGAADAPEAGYAKRISFVIGEDGCILHAYAKVDPKTHLDQVLSDLAAS